MKKRSSPSTSTDTEQAGNRKIEAGRLLFFLLSILVLAAAVLFLIAAFRFAWRGNEIIRDGGAPHLTMAERLYLQAYLSSRVEALDAPIGNPAPSIEFEIAPGSGAGEIADQMIELGLINDRELFLNYARYYGYDRQLEAGYFLIPGGTTTAELAKRLTEARDPFITLSFLEGWRMEEMAMAIAENGGDVIDSNRFLAIARRQIDIDLSPYDFLGSLPRGATLEGFLFPDTYRLPRNSTADDLVGEMLDNFATRVDPALRQAIGLQNLTIYEAVILASVVQREAVLDSEKPLIARVFLNRLENNMRLEADPTVQYAVGFQPDTGRWWKSGLTLKDLRIDSPYNTYLYRGLMPGPIANPGLTALQGVAYPAESDALFFVVDCASDIPNAHIFSKTFAEHLENVERCR